MQITGMLHGARLLQFVGFPAAEALGPAASEDDIKALIGRCGAVFVKPVFKGGKLSVHDSREIRALGQQRGVDIFGANSLGVADSWNEVRIGGALGGDAPGESLRKGSIAIFSNSGGFTTTIAGYLLSAGWGTTTLISSGKDVYIHFAAPEFAFALANDARSKAAVLYCEPGGHYELDAVMRENGVRPDFAPEGSLALKPWFASNGGLALPRELDLPVVVATAPYGEQIALLEKQIGTIFPRQPMKDASGASQLDKWTEVASLHGVSMLEAARNSLETNLCLALVREPGDENDRALINVAAGASLYLHGDPMLAAAQAARA